MNITTKTLIKPFLLLLFLKMSLMLAQHTDRSAALSAAGLLHENDDLVNIFWERQLRITYLLLLLYPFFLTIKLLCITFILDIGFNLLNQPIPFKHSLFAVIASEFCYLLPDVIRLFANQHWAANPYLPYISYTPLAMSAAEHFPLYIRYLFNSFNLFEWGYMLLLSFLLNESKSGQYWKTLGHVLQTYGLFMLGWSLCMGLYLDNALRL